ncbi:hypothetical protein NE237_000145 [Protea cynaroides]|uniref:Uncharacterized protein n=1 Tax=Protea cynaroides TaxID=273540 RepID=A0A9Q0JR32_9MAGN|nr:hypothetical protein NE237_000145 [Protea cynaroides]
MNASLGKSIVLGSPTCTVSVSSKEIKNLDSTGPMGNLPVVAAGTGGVNPQSSDNTPRTNLAVHEDSSHCELANLMVERVKAWDAERFCLLQQHESIAQDLKRERESTITKRRKFEPLRNDLGFVASKHALCRLCDFVRERTLGYDFSIFIMDLDAPFATRFQ